MYAPTHTSPRQTHARTHACTHKQIEALRARDEAREEAARRRDAAERAARARLAALDEARRRARCGRLRALKRRCWEEAAAEAAGAAAAVP